MVRRRAMQVVKMRPGSAPKTGGEPTVIPVDLIDEALRVRSVSLLRLHA